MLRPQAVSRPNDHQEGEQSKDKDAEATPATQAANYRSVSRWPRRRKLCLGCRRRRELRSPWGFAWRATSHLVLNAIEKCIDLVFVVTAFPKGRLRESYLADLL
jgi:predicted Fe-S protein YdhL (DUF1289 family)